MLPVHCVQVDKVMGLHPDKGIPGCDDKLLMVKTVRQWDRELGEGELQIHHQCRLWRGV